MNPIESVSECDAIPSYSDNMKMVTTRSLCEGQRLYKSSQCDLRIKGDRNSIRSNQEEQGKVEDDEELASNVVLGK
jgi:hypothetical protein